MQSRLDQQLLLFQDALSSVPGEKLTEKQRQRREQALQQTIMTDLQTKRFQASQFDKKTFETHAMEGIKTFSTKNFQTRNLSLREKTFPTNKLAMPSFETKNYSLPDNPGYETRTFATNKLGLRTFTESEGKWITGRKQPASELARQKLGKPTKATEVVDPTSIFPGEGTAPPPTPDQGSSEKPASK